MTRRYDAIVRERDADDAALKETEKEIARLTGEVSLLLTLRSDFRTPSRACTNEVILSGRSD